MDVQFYGANCLVFTGKDFRIVVDDNLTSLGVKSVTKAGDIVLFTDAAPEAGLTDARIIIDMPGEYELGSVSITGIPARGHMEQSGKVHATTMYKLSLNDVDYLVTGHIFPELSDQQLERIGMIDVMFVPVGGNGYTLDAVGALKVVKMIEPKLVVPTHYANKALAYEVPQQELSAVLNDIAIEAMEPTSKLRIKGGGDLGELMRLQVLEKS